jgi:dsDNA-specific endonuclease/ATPase MutS2
MKNINIFASKVTNELDVHGCTVYEMLEKTTHYLDLASLSSFERVTIVHGMGKLRKSLHEHLDTLKKGGLISNYALGGVFRDSLVETVVYL